MSADSNDLCYKKIHDLPCKNEKHLRSEHLGSAVTEIPIEFNLDGSVKTTAIYDHSANVHVCNDKSMFVRPPRLTDKHFIASISGTQTNANEMGIVKWTLTDDAWKKHTLEIENVLYSPQFPFNVLSLEIDTTVESVHSSVNFRARS